MYRYEYIISRKSPATASVVINTITYVHNRHGDLGAAVAKHEHLMALTVQYLQIHCYSQTYRFLTVVGLKLLCWRSGGLISLEAHLISRYKTFMCNNTNMATCTTYVHVFLAVIPHPPKK